jgi:hypothetical protein
VTEHIVKAMFEVFIMAQVGDETKALFWSHHWLEGSFVLDLAPLVVTTVQPRARKSSLVTDSLQNAQWIHNIIDSLSVQALTQYITLWSRMHDVHLTNESDRFIWKWSANQQYSAASAYRAFFHGHCGIAGAKELSKVRAPPTCKFFF